MKSLKTFPLIVFCLCLQGIVFSQTNSIKYPMSWELQLGSSFLTNTTLSKNHPYQSIKSISGNFYSYVDFQRKSFIFRPGIGVASQNFGLNKMIVVNGDQTEFHNFSSNFNYQYSYLQKMFIEIPLGLLYTTQYNTKQRYFEYETGVKFGYLIYSESQHLLKISPKEYTVFTEKNLPQLNPFQFGTYIKFSSRKVQLNRTLGTSFSISSQYNFSQVFDNGNNTPTQSYSFMLGMGLFINKMN